MIKVKMLMFFGGQKMSSAACFKLFFSYGIQQWHYLRHIVQ